MNLDDIFNLMQAESARLRLPLSHTQGLEVDRGALAQYRPKAFIWVLRQTNTGLYWGEKGHTWALLYWQLRLNPGQTMRYYHYDGGRFQPVSFAVAVSYLKEMEKGFHGDLRNLGRYSDYNNYFNTHLERLLHEVPHFTPRRLLWTA